MCGDQEERNSNDEGTSQAVSRAGMANGISSEERGHSTRSLDTGTRGLPESGLSQQLAKQNKLRAKHSKPSTEDEFPRGGSRYPGKGKIRDHLHKHPPVLSGIIHSVVNCLSSSQFV